MPNHLSRPAICPLPASPRCSVGDDGLGKTTFVRNLFAAYASDVDFPVDDASARGAS